MDADGEAKLTGSDVANEQILFSLKQVLLFFFESELLSLDFSCGMFILTFGHI